MKGCVMLRAGRRCPKKKTGLSKHITCHAIVQKARSYSRYRTVRVITILRMPQSVTMPSPESFDDEYDDEALEEVMAKKNATVSACCCL